MVPTQGSIPQALSCLPRQAPLTWPSFCLKSGYVTPLPTPSRAARLWSKVHFKLVLKRRKKTLEKPSAWIFFLFGSFISSAQRHLWLWLLLLPLILTLKGTNCPSHGDAARTNLLSAWISSCKESIRCTHKNYQDKGTLWRFCTVVVF